MIRDKFFWASYGKFSLAAVAGLALATFVLGVPADVSVRLGVGALFSFPVAYGFASNELSKRHGKTGGISPLGM
jgi:hypothetical protein